MNIGASIRKLTLLFIAIFIALSAGLVYWQVIAAPSVVANIHNSRHCLPDSAPVRGRIFDRNGVLLADSELTTNSGVCGYQRHYFLNGEPSLANLIGYYISPLYSSSGVEKMYNQYLNGDIGLTALNNIVNKVLHRPPVGDDIYLTIDSRIQKIVEKYFDADVVPADNFNVFKTNRGSVIVTDPHTGEILAMVSRPTFDANRVASGDLAYFDSLVKDVSQPLVERPIDSCYVPGSTYKTMTLLAGLDSGVAHLTDPFYHDYQAGHLQAIGPITVGSGDHTETITNGDNIAGFTHIYPVTLNYGFSHSDNIIYAQVGVEVGATTWLGYNNRFYVGKTIPFDLPVKVSTVTPQDAAHLCSYGAPQNTQLFTNQLAENAFGQGVDSITPLQMSLFDDAIANNGALMQPTIIEKIVDPNGAVVQPFNPQSLGTPVSDTTASQLRDAMYGVVQCGSGRFSSPLPELNLSPWNIIAKTGTGQVPQNPNSNQVIPAEAWLITQAPYQNPRLTIVAMKENGGEGGSVNGPMVKDIYNDIFTQVIKIPLPPTPDPNYCSTTGLLQP
jgi:penicillin-binding protein A